MSGFNPTDLGFLQGDPAPVSQRAASARPNPLDVLPQDTADELLRLDGVVGAWIERDEHGQRYVALHTSRPMPASALPAHAAGLPTRIVGGEPIRPLPAAAQRR